MRKRRCDRTYGRGADAEATSADDMGEDNGEDLDGNSGPQVEEMD